MKYFTLSWWSDAATDNGQTWKAYEKHWKSIAAQIPSDLQQLYGEYNLHDAHLRVFCLNVSKKSLVLEFSRFDRDFSLGYGGLESVTSTADPDEGLSGPHGYGDLGYDEIEIIKPGLFEHRMLFSSGIELQIQFTDFSLQTEPPLPGKCDSP